MSDNKEIPDYLKEAGEKYAKNDLKHEHKDVKELFKGAPVLKQMRCEIIMRHFIAGYQAARYHQEPVAERDEKELMNDPFIKKHLDIIWQKMKDVKIEMYIKPMFDSLNAASIKYFLETGTINGGFRDSLNAMMDSIRNWKPETPSHENTTIQKLIDELNETSDGINAKTDYDKGLMAGVKVATNIVYKYFSHESVVSEFQAEVEAIMRENKLLKEDLANSSHEGKDKIVIDLEEMRKDKSEGSYYYGWQANIAMAFKDEYDAMIKEQPAENWLHELANKAAKRFLDMLLIQPQKQ